MNGRFEHKDVRQQISDTKALETEAPIYLSQKSELTSKPSSLAKRKHPRIENTGIGKDSPDMPSKDTVGQIVAMTFTQTSKGMCVEAGEYKSPPCLLKHLWQDCNV